MDTKGVGTSNAYEKKRYWLKDGFIKSCSNTRIIYMANADPISRVKTEIINLEPYDKDTEYRLDALYYELAHLLKAEPYCYKTDFELEDYVLDRTKEVLKNNFFKEINVRVYSVIEEEIRETYYWKENEPTDNEPTEKELTDIEAIEKETEQSYWD